MNGEDVWWLSKISVLKASDCYFDHPFFTNLPLTPFSKSAVVTCSFKIQIKATPRIKFWYDTDMACDRHEQCQLKQTFMIGQEQS